MDFMWRPYARSSLRLLGKDNVRKNIMFLRIATLFGVISVWDIVRVICS